LLHAKLYLSVDNDDKPSNYGKLNINLSHLDLHAKLITDDEGLNVIQDWNVSSTKNIFGILADLVGTIIRIVVDSKTNNYINKIKIMGD